MGAFKRVAEYLGLVDGELDQDEVLDVEPSSDRRVPELVSDRVDRPVRGRRSEPAVLPTFRPALVEAPARVPAKISTHSPRSYNDARPIGEDFREGIPVIVNLTDLDDADAKRIVDFAAGLVFGLQGSIERVTTKVFLLSPANVDVSAQTREQVERGEFFNQS